MTGKMDNAFAVVTTDSNNLVRPLHNRMPVIVDQADWTTWLDSSCPVEDAKVLLRPYPAERMELQAVSPYVNIADHEGPECFAPAEPELKTLFD